MLALVPSGPLAPGDPAGVPFRANSTWREPLSEQPEIQAFECDPVILHRNVPTDIRFNWSVIGAKRVEVWRNGQDEFGREEKRVHAADRPDDLDATDLWSNFPSPVGQDRVVNHAWYWLRACGEESPCRKDEEGDWTYSDKIEVTEGPARWHRPREQPPPTGRP